MDTAKPKASPARSEEAWDALIRIAKAASAAHRWIKKNGHLEAHAHNRTGTGCDACRTLNEVQESLAAWGALPEESPGPSCPGVEDDEHALTNHSEACVAPPVEGAPRGSTAALRTPLTRGTSRDPAFADACMPWCNSKDRRPAPPPPCVSEVPRCNCGIDGQPRVSAKPKAGLAPSTPEYVLTAEMVLRNMRGLLIDGPKVGLIAEALRVAYSDGHADGMRAARRTGSAPVTEWDGTPPFREVGGYASGPLPTDVSYGLGERGFDGLRLVGPQESVDRFTRMLMRLEDVDRATPTPCVGAETKEKTT